MRIQSRILQILYFKDRKYPTKALHKELNFPKIKDLYELKILKFINDKSVPYVFQNYFRLNEGKHNYATLTLGISQGAGVTSLTHKCVNNRKRGCR